jgi:hypothetical protein
LIDTYTIAATGTFEGDLWSVWEQNNAVAILTARKYWQRIPKSIYQERAEIIAQAQTIKQNQAINDIVRRELGMIGIFPGNVDGTGGSLVSIDRMFFVASMAAIRENEGDPPALPEMKQFAPGVLRGQIDPIQALNASLPAANRQQLVTVLQVAPQTSKFFRSLAVIAAAMALPREQFSELGF